ncbi:hypothetical protein CJF32_00011107 [Rutstroemia sp. NJR-2017a WRK4]|nr:hypothetical protein CJF32_00011107 [Rutstroemia sp. NJR-2017a WRK4]
MLLLIYTGYRPAELVHIAKGKIAADRDQIYEDGNWDNESESLDKTKDDDPSYESSEPWVNPKNSDYDDEDHEDILIREYKALYYEDIRLWIVRNPTLGERDLLGMEITLAYHKGADRKPKPTTFLFHEEALPILYPISHILAIVIRDNAIKVDRFTHTEPFFTSNLQDPTKAVLIHWKPEKLKLSVTQPLLTTSTVLAGLPGAATTAVRDQVMRYNPQTGVFCGSYINEKVRFIVQDAVLD